MGNNFTRPNWLRFIIYDLGNNPLWMGKAREKEWWVSSWAERGRVEVAQEGGKSICE